MSRANTRQAAHIVETNTLLRPGLSTARGWCRSYLSTIHGIRKGKLSNCSGSRTLFAYRFALSLVNIITAKAIKPVLYSIEVKKGSKNKRKAALKAQNAILVSRLLNACFTVTGSSDFRSHANRMVECPSTTSQ